MTQAQQAAVVATGEAAVWMAPSKLKPCKDNPRANDGEPVERVAALIQKFGFGAPIVARRANFEIIAGHTRWKAANKLKLKHVPVRLLDVSEDDAHKLALADNRATELTGWTESLGAMLAAYDMADAALLGWSAAEISKLQAQVQGEVIEDEAPEPPKKPVTKRGDVWQLGKHRIVCGDATDASVVGQVLAGAKPLLLVTDPPYGVDYDPEWRKRAGINNSERMGTVENDNCASWVDAYKLFTGAVAYIWHSSLHSEVVAADLAACKFTRRSQIIWAKPSLIVSRGHYHWQHEPCWYAVREGQTAKWTGDRKQSTLWTISPRDGSEETVHSTQKPVECMARPMRNHGGADDAVYDSFLGSGTSISAAEQLGRVCYGCELRPAYCDVVVERWQNLTGAKAVRANGTATRRRAR